MWACPPPEAGKPPAGLWLEKIAGKALFLHPRVFDMVIGYIFLGLAVCGFLAETWFLFKDFLPGYGSTMGGQMLTGAIWTLSSLLASIGLWLCLPLPWYGIPISFVVLWFIRWPYDGILEKAYLRFGPPGEG
jgi:hypothetical protein